MNVDRILDTLNRHQVAYLLIGGMNFLLRHKPVLTYDVDVWIEDTTENLHRCEAALADLEAEWGATESDWKPVAGHPRGWLRTQALFCLNSPHGAIDVFRRVKGLEEWHTCATRALRESTASSVPYRGLSDADMLQSQLALDEHERNHERIATLKAALNRSSHA
jgi:hypothetical protein